VSSGVADTAERLCRGGRTHASAPAHGLGTAARRAVRRAARSSAGSERRAPHGSSVPGAPCSAGGCACRAPAGPSRPGAGRRADEGLRLVGESAGYAEIADAIEAVPGVVAHGLFVGVATSAVVATPDGPRILRRVRRSRRARCRAWRRALAVASVRVGQHSGAPRPAPGARRSRRARRRAWERALALARVGVWCRLGACRLWPGRGLQPAALSAAPGGAQEEQSALRSG